MIRYPQVAARLFNTPLLMHPGKLDAIIAGLAPRFGADGVLDLRAYTSLQVEKKAPGYRVVDGVGVLDLFGVLVYRSRMEARSQGQACANVFY